MIIDKLDSKVAPLVATIIQKYCYDLSSVPCLVGYKASINGIRMTEIGGYDSKGYKAILLNDVAPEELTSEDFSYMLVDSELNMAGPKSNFVELSITPEVTGYTYAHKFAADELEMLQQGTFCIKTNESLSSTEHKFNLNGSIKSIELELLFVRRKELALLPAEFKGFRKYMDWLTLGKSVMPIAEVTIKSPDTLAEIEVSAKDSRFEPVLMEDLRAVAEKLL